MAGKKYEKYFIREIDPFVQRGPGPTPVRLDDTVMKGSHFYWVVLMPELSEPNMPVGHPPHIHKDAELLFHIGTNPDDPTDLGAEVEFYMGREMERYVITKSCVVYIPPGFIHAPWRPLKTYRPWVFVEVNQGLRHTEKFYPQLLTREQREQIDWSRWQDEGY
jgi:hypothetical protein